MSYLERGELIKVKDRFAPIEKIRENIRLRISNPPLKDSSDLYSNSLSKLGLELNSIEADLNLSLIGTMQYPNNETHLSGLIKLANDNITKIHQLEDQNLSK